MQSGRNILMFRRNIVATLKTLYLTNQLKPWSRVLLQKLSVAQLLKNFPTVLWNPKVHYHIHKIPALVSILSQINPVHTTSILTLSFRLRLGLPSGLFASGFPMKILYTLLFYPWLLHAYPSHLPWLVHSNYTWWRIQVLKLLIMQFSPTSCHFIPLRSKFVFRETKIGELLHSWMWRRIFW
jgi:hypothetical protein